MTSRKEPTDTMADEQPTPGRYAQRRSNGRRPASMEFEEAEYEATKDSALYLDRSVASYVRQTMSESNAKLRKRADFDEVVSARKAKQAEKKVAAKP